MKMQKNKKLVQAAAVGLSVCVLAGGGLFVWNMYGKNAEENEKQIVSDEVAEIESLNSRDNVVDLEELFEGEKASGKEDVTSEKTEKKEDAFTEPGNGEVQDDIQNGSSKEFLTITTKNNNTFYLVIDRSSTSQNVYLLSQVDENDLKEFVDQEKEPATVTPTPQVVIDENKTEETDKKEEIAKPEKEKMPQANMGAMAAILILALGGVAAYYYFKIYKPKKEEEDDFEEEGLETSDGLEIINEDEFEDREEENE